MKSEKGITLTSVIIYVLVLVIVVGIISVLTSFFYGNIDQMDKTSQSSSEFNKFNMYFLKDVKEQGNKVVSYSDVEGGKYIAFQNNHIYSYQNNAIYFDKVKICEEVTDFSVSLEQGEGKQLITIYLTIGKENPFSKTSQYTLNLD